MLFKENVYFKSSLLEGFKASLGSFKIIGKNKSILFFYIIPFLLNIILLSVLMYLAFVNIAPWLKGYLTGDAWYIKLLSVLITPILLLLLFFFTTIIYGFIGNILCSPFLDILSQKTQKAISDRIDDEPFSFKRFLGDIVRTIKNLFKMIGVIILASILPLFLLLILPPIGPALYTLCCYFTTSLVLGLQFLDYPLERKRYSFTEKFKITWKFRYSAIGLGLSFLIVSMVPILGFLGINMCVMGATIIFEKDIVPTLKKYEIEQL
jgi:CysZ protein